VCTAVGKHGAPLLASDGRNGAYATWTDSRPAGRVYATRLDARGRLGTGWPTGGRVVSRWVDIAGNPVDGVEALTITPTDDGSAIVAWDSWQRVLTRSDPVSVSQAYAMRLDPAGIATSSVPSVSEPVATGSVPTAERSRFALRGVQPNPSSAGGVVTFALPEARTALLELFDIAGRCVWSRDVTGLGAGEHQVRLRDGAWSPTGLYLLRLTQGERRATSRVSIVH
jgi:hypothetical protein